MTIKYEEQRGDYVLVLIQIIWVLKNIHISNVNVGNLAELEMII